MAQGPEEWFTLETLTKHATGIVLGATGLAIAIKRGWVFIGDRTKLANELADTETKLAVAIKDIEFRDHKIEALEAKVQMLETQVAQAITT